MSGRLLTHSSFLYLQSRECPDSPARPLKRLSPNQGESLALLRVVTDRRTGREDFSEEIRTFIGRFRYVRVTLRRRSLRNLSYAAVS